MGANTERGIRTAIAVLDVHYLQGGAHGAAVLIPDWPSRVVLEARTNELWDAGVLPG